MDDPKPIDDVIDDPQSTSTQPAPTAPIPSADYERRYKGLQVTYQKLEKKQHETEAALNAATAELEEMRAKVRNLEEQIVGHQKGSSETQLLIEDLKKQLQVAQTKQERMKVISTEFPDLLAFEASNLLPESTSDEELRQKLTAFKNAIQGTRTAAVQNIAQGSTPAISGASNTMTKDSVYAELMSLAGKTDTDPAARRRYEELMAVWLKE